MAKKYKKPFDALDNDEAEETPADLETSDDGLIEMRKGGETLRVHPTCARDHQEKGWQ